MRSRSQKNDDLDAYFCDINQPNSSDYDNSGAFISDDFIHIPDDDDDEDEHDIGQPSAFSFDGIQVSMGRLEVPSGAAASVAEPIINGADDDIMPSNNPPPLKKFRQSNDFPSDDLSDRGKPSTQFERNLQAPLLKFRLTNGFHSDNLSDCGKSSSPVQRNLHSPAVTLTHTHNISAPEPAKAADTDYHFLMSLLPYMIDLSPSQKLKVRMKIQKLIFKELYKDDVDNE